MRISYLSVEVRRKKIGFAVSVWKWWFFYGRRIQRMVVNDYADAVNAAKNFLVYYGEKEQGWYSNES